jgi:allantoate deiminase
MSLRQDALAGAVEMMALVEAETRRRGEPLVATVGFLEVTPNTPNVVPGSVSFTVDARHTRAEELASFSASLETSFAAIAARRRLGIAMEPRLTVEPVAMDPNLQTLIHRSCEARKLSHLTLPSGAGHDSQVMASLCPTAMLFIPSRKGISHSPLEYSTQQALADGLSVLSDVLYELAWKGTTS